MGIVRVDVRSRGVAPLQRLLNDQTMISLRRLCLTPLVFARSLACVLIIGLAPVARSGEVTVFAAASLKNALDEIVNAFSHSTEHNVTVSYAGSSTLARHIEFGAPADVFISANLAWMDRLQSQDRIVRETRRDIASNSLVLIGSGSTSKPLDLTQDVDLRALLGGGFLAMALVDAVPAGIYGKAALIQLGYWDNIADQVAQTDSVRAALALVATGAAPLGIVYTSDAQSEPRVFVIGTFPTESHPEIRYPAAAISGRDTPLVRSFLDYLHSNTAKNILTRQGFVVMTE